MTISDAVPHNWPLRATVADGGAAMLRAIGAESSVDFVIGPQATPVQAMEQAGAMVALALPRFLEGVQGADHAYAAAQAVLTELIDITARHKAGPDLLGRVSFDGMYVTVSVGDIDCPLPSTMEEPGMITVHRVATAVQQHAGTMGGRVTWAAIPVRT